MQLGDCQSEQSEKRSFRMLTLVDAFYGVIGLDINADFPFRQFFA